jgi:hypothetical protein
LERSSAVKAATLEASSINSISTSDVSIAPHLRRKDSLRPQPEVLGFNCVLQRSQVTLINF